MRGFADCLRAHGFDAWIDQYALDPDEGWPRWMQRELDRADFVLIVPSAVYLRRWKGEVAPGVGHGATWEGLVMTNRLYRAHGKAAGIRCVLVGDAGVDQIPDPLAGHTWFRPPDDCERLDRYLRGVPVGSAAPLGSIGECALVLEIPEGTVKSRLRRGKELLREAIVQGGGYKHERWETDDEMDAWISDIYAELGERRLHRPPLA